MASLRNLLRDVEALKEILHNLSDVAIQDALNLDSVVDPAGLSQQQLIDVLMESFPALLDRYMQGAAQITASWYEDLAPKSAYRAFVPDLDMGERLMKSARWAASAPGDATIGTRLGGVAQRAIMDSSRRTVMANAKQERVKYARVAHAGACEFCLLLASRGAVYHSEDTAKRGHTVDASHDMCFCTIVAVRPGTTLFKPKYLKDFEKKYNAATGDPEVIRARRPGADKNAYTKAVLAKIREIDASDKVAEKTAALWDSVTSSTNKAELEVAAKALTGIPWDLSNLEDESRMQAISAVRAVHETQQQYPKMKLESVSFAYAQDRPIAYALTYPKNWTDAGGGARVVMNTNWFNDPVGVNDQFHNDVKGGHHPEWIPRGEGAAYRKMLLAMSAENKTNAAYPVMIHELGHVMVVSSGTGVMAGDQSMMALSSYYQQHHNQSSTGFRKWLSDNMSGYSFDGSGGVAEHEAMAEAFSDVQINGDNAKETSKVLNKVLIDNYNGIPFSSSQKWPDFKPRKPSGRKRRRAS